MTTVTPDNPNDTPDTPDTPEEPKDGLSGGAIAGIVIGSVATVGIGVFSVIWFAVQKKSFADLGVVIAKGAGKVGSAFKKLFSLIKGVFKKK